MDKLAEDISEREISRRTYPRLPFKKSLRYRVCKKGSSSEYNEGFALNMSQGGILFSVKETPPLSSMLILELDMKMPFGLLTIGDRFIGKVVRVKKRKDAEGYEVSLSFVKKQEKNREDVREALAAVA